MRRFTSLLTAVVLVLTIGSKSHADELESLLSGFENQSSSSIGDDGEGDIDDLLEGFDDQQEALTVSAVPYQPALPEWLKLSGSLALQSTVNFSQPEPLAGQPDYRGLSMFRGAGELLSDLSYQGWKARVGISMFYDAAYQLNGQRQFYTDEFLDQYESELRVDEAYLQGGLGSSLDLKMGRQIVVWGKSDNIRVTDILTPLDLRLPGLVDIRFLRLPVTMTKLDYYQGNWNLEGMVIHEPRFNKFPVFNGEFYPLDRPLPDSEEPEISWSNQQAALSLNGIFSGWDIAFYGAYVFDRQPFFSDLPSTVREYDKVLFGGLAANYAVGNWLLKGEAALTDGLRFSNIDEEKQRFDFLLGFDYSGFSETTITLEFANRHLIDFDERLAQPPDGQKKDWTQFAFRLTKDFLNDTLHLTLLASSYGIFAGEGGFERFQLEYDLRDNLKLTGGVVLYQSGDFPSFQNAGDNDRLLFEIEYRF
ncbi:MAG: hypothetical protein KJO28_04205 [Desulfofustis sp.]|nr:hypothetical protein [Desulfofustis sp.]